MKLIPRMLSTGIHHYSIDPTVKSLTSSDKKKKINPKERKFSPFVWLISSWDKPCEYAIVVSIGQSIPLPKELDVECRMNLDFLVRVLFLWWTINAADDLFYTLPTYLQYLFLFSRDIPLSIIAPRYRTVDARQNGKTGDGRLTDRQLPRHDRHDISLYL